MVYLEQDWKKYLNTIYRYGHNHKKDDSDIKEYIGIHYFIKSPFFFKVSADNFLEQIQEGIFNINGYPMKNDALYDYVASWENPRDDFIYTYPDRIFNYPQNQYDIIKKRLKENLGTNRAVAIIYDPEKDAEEEHIPCLNWLQALVRNNELILNCIFRSNDIYGAWPSNMLFLTYLGLKLSDDFNIKYHGLHYHCSSAHYYKTDEPAVLEVIK